MSASRSASSSTTPRVRLAARRHIASRTTGLARTAARRCALDTPHAVASAPAERVSDAVDDASDFAPVSSASRFRTPPGAAMTVAATRWRGRSATVSAGGARRAANAPSRTAHAIDGSSGSASAVRSFWSTLGSRSRPGSRPGSFEGSFEGGYRSLSFAGKKGSLSFVAASPGTFVVSRNAAFLTASPPFRGLRRVARRAPAATTCRSSASVTQSRRNGAFARLRRSASAEPAASSVEIPSGPVPRRRGGA